MKNMFKLMGIALLAGAMLFTACKKDEEDDTNTNTNNTPAETTPAVSVVFGTTTWTSNDTMEYVATANEGIVEFSIYKAATDNEPTIMIRTGLEKGSTYRFYGTNYGLVYWVGTGADVVEYNTVTEDSQINITDVDLVNLKLSAAVAATMVKDGVNTALTITLSNATWKVVTK